MKATLTAYYNRDPKQLVVSKPADNRDPKQLVVSKPAGDWMAFDAFLKSLGFRRARANGLPVPGRFEFLSGNPDEIETVIGIVKAGGEYLTSGNFEFTSQI